jgi:hypothetical protein
MSCHPHPGPQYTRRRANNPDLGRRDGRCAALPFWRLDLDARRSGEGERPNNQIEDLDGMNPSGQFRTVGSDTFSAIRRKKGIDQKVVGEGEGPSISHQMIYYRTTAVTRFGETEDNVCNK